ncbi:unnamed protein product, partial [Trichobilharzia regenti]
DENISEEFKKQTSQNSSLIAVNLNSSCRIPPPSLRPTLSPSPSSSSSSVSPSLPPSSMLWKHSSQSSHSSSSESTSDDRERNTNDNITNSNSTERTDTTVTSYYSTTTSTPATATSQANVYFKCGSATTSCSDEFQPKLITNHNNNNENLDGANVDNGNKSESGRHKMINTHSSTSATTAKHHNHAKGRQMYVMRHAERVDMSFGHAWVTQCFDHKGRSLKCVLLYNY